MIQQEKVIGQIIIETATTSQSMVPSKIVEKRGDRLLGEGILQEANMKNRNGRFYDSRDLFPELVAPRQIELLKTGNLRAENGHPLSKDLNRQQTIDPNNCVAIFTNLWTDGDFVMGRFFGTYNSKGEEFNQELAHGLSPSWSLRALGTITNTARGAEVKQIKLITYDRVIYPSHNKAYTTGIVDESAMVGESNKLIVPDNDPGMVIPITNQSVINYIQSESLNLKQIKESFDLLYEDISLVNKNHVRLVDRAGSSFIITLEEYIYNEIINTVMDSIN